MTAQYLYLEAREAIDAYKRRLRSSAKKQYAELYLDWVLSDRANPEPREGFDFMLRQAVRIDINSILRHSQPGYVPAY